jgi:hypothetical protein
MEQIGPPHTRKLGTTTQFLVGGTWTPWQKPRNCLFIMILTIGAGGGGGGGLNTASGAGAQHGGLGGGSAAIRKSFFFAPHLPDTLWVYVGLGGAGGSADVAGSNGESSCVGVLPEKNVNHLLSSANGGVGGGNGTSGGGGTGGTAATFSTECYLGGPMFGIEPIAIASFYNEHAFVAGLTATTRTASAYSARAVLQSGTITLPGGNGGSWSGTTQRAGEGFAASTNSVIPAVGGGATGGGRGVDGYIVTMQPPIFTGASGGGCNSGGTGGAGGNGAPGCGGGGGGAGNGTGGAGGRGGDGLIVIAAR